MEFIAPKPTDFEHPDDIAANGRQVGERPPIVAVDSTAHFSAIWTAGHGLGAACVNNDASAQINADDLDAVVGA